MRINCQKGKCHRAFCSALRIAKFERAFASLGVPCSWQNCSISSTSSRMRWLAAQVDVAILETPNRGSGSNCARRQQQKNNAHGSSLRPSESSTFSRCLCEKGLNLLLHFGAVAAGALNSFFVVLADCHCEGESLTTLFAKIFVKRHRDPPLGFLWLRNQNIIVLR